MRRWLAIVVSIGLIGLFFITALVVFAFLITGENPLRLARQTYYQITLSLRADELNRPAGTNNQSMRFVVAPGSTTASIGTALQANQLINDADLFVNYVVGSALDGQLEAGTYFLSDTLTIPEITQRLTDSNSSQIRFRILEGWRSEEIAEAIDQSGLFNFTGNDFLTVTRNSNDVPASFAVYAELPQGATLEGFLYPDTYLLPPDIRPEALRDLLLETFRQRVTEQMANDLLNQGWSLYEAVTLASIVEREAVHAEEHAMIASVYRNRLDQGIKLDADPTIQYALGNTRGRWWGNITRDDYTGVISPYNTYLNFGLPPSPIANVSISTLEAVIYPEASDYIYFRAACDSSGYHEFAITYEEHLQNGCTG
ncbi:MAG: endolytic transglycosylase MltG [Phototrophicaceae bacterium]